MFPWPVNDGRRYLLACCRTPRPAGRANRRRQKKRRFTVVSVDRRGARSCRCSCSVGPAACGQQLPFVPVGPGSEGQSHDGPLRRPPTDFDEPGRRESGGVSGGGGTGRDGAVEGDCLDRRRSSRAREIYPCGDQCGHDAVPAMALAYVEAGEDPHGNVVDTAGAPVVFNRRHRLPRTYPAPSHGHPLPQGQHSWRWSLPHDTSKVGPVALRRAPPVLRAEQRRHAPAPTRRTALVK